MRIDAVWVERFGPLQQRHLSVPTAGLVPLVGPNESGKSSWLRVIREMLYGFSGTRADVEPLAAAMRVVRGQESLTIERRGRTLAVQDGHGAAKAPLDLTAWLGDTSRETFTTVYGIDLDQMTHLGELSRDLLESQLSAAGLGLRVNLAHVEKALLGRVRELWGTQGRGQQPLARHVRELRELDRRIRMEERREETYEALLSREEEAKRAVEAAKAGDADAQRGWQRTQHMRDLWPRYERLREVEAFLGKLSPPAEASSDDRGHVRRLLDEEKRLAEDLVERERTVAAASALLPPGALVQAVGDSRWESVMRDAARLPAWVREAEGAEMRAADWHVALAGQALALGLDPRLLREGLPVDVWRARAEQALDEDRRRRQEVDGLRLSAAELQNAQEEGHEGSGPLAPVPERVVWEVEGALLDAALQQRAPLATPTLGLVVLAGVLGLGSGLTGGRIVTVVLGGAAFVAALTAWLLAGRQMVDVAGERLSLGNSAALRGAMRRHHEAGERLAAYEFQKERLSLLEQERQRAEAAVREAMSRLEEDRRRFQDWWREAGCPPLDPESALAYVERVREASITAARWREEDGRRAGAQARVMEFEAQAVAAARGSGIPEGLVPAARNLAAWETLIASWRALPGQRERVDQAVQARDACAAALARVRAGLDGLAITWHLPSRDGLRDRLSEWEEADRLSTERDVLLEALGAGNPDGSGRAAYDAWWPDGPDESLALSAGAADEARAQVTEALERLVQRQAEREALERSGTLAALKLERSIRLEQASREATSWAAAQLALETLQGAIRRYERESQPAVLEAASLYLQEITGGRYERIVRPLLDEGVGGLHVEGPAGTFTPDQLSRGTKEQLYLALRLAWIRERARHGVDLPVLLDDILVNSDPARQATLAKLLARFAEEMQVLYFTCHPHMARLLEEAGALNPVGVAL